MRRYFFVLCLLLLLPQTMWGEGKTTGEKLTWGQTDLQLGVMAGDLPKVKKLVGEESIGEAGLNKPDRNGWTALHWVALSPENTKPIARLLIGAGADINAVTAEGTTPLHLAAHHNKPGLASLLLSAGAEIDKKGPFDMTPLHWAAYRRDGDMVILLLDHDANKEARNRFGQTPLTFALSRSDLAGSDKKMPQIEKLLTEKLLKTR